jgi:hypothetical protein
LFFSAFLLSCFTGKNRAYILKKIKNKKEKGKEAQSMTGIIDWAAGCVFKHLYAAATLVERVKDQK